MIACSEPPEGRSSQPLELLGERLVALNVVDSISRETVRRTLKKRFETASYAVSVHSGGEQRRLRMLDGGCAQGLSAEIQRGRGPGLHSRGEQATDEGGPHGFADRSRPAGALRLRIRAQRDGESVHGSCAACGPGHVKITDRRTKKDFAELLRDIADIHFPGKKIVLVTANLNTHKLSSLYHAFPPEQAGRLRKRFEVCHAPKHGTRLNIAESEISVLNRQCLSRRIPDRKTLCREVSAWEKARNADPAPVKQRFTAEDARTELHSL